MSTKKDMEMDSRNVVTMGIFGLIIYLVLRMFELPIAEESDIMLYAVWAFGILLLNVFVPIDVSFSILTPKVLILTIVLFIGGMMLYVVASGTGNTFLLEVDLLIVSIGTILFSLSRVGKDR